MNGKDLSKVNYICRTVTEVPAYVLAKVKVPKGETVFAGELTKLSELDETLGYGNWDVYTFDNNIKEKDTIGIVLNNSFETLTDNRRPNGNPDYTQYIYREGAVLTVARLLPEIKFELSPDVLVNIDEVLQGCIDNIDFTNTYIGITSRGFEWTDDLSLIHSKAYFVVEATKWFRLGGQFGGEFAFTFIVRVKYKDELGNPGITNFTITPMKGLIEGNENVAVGAKVADMSTTGGTPPYTYAFNNAKTKAINNDLFSIEGSQIKVKSSPLVTGNYEVSVTVTDSAKKTKTTNATIEVVAPEITAIRANATPGLQVGNANVASGATVLTMMAEGGIAPYNYEFVSNGEASADNSKFVIAGDKINVGTNALTEAKTYKVYVKATDSNQKTFNEGFDIVVAATAQA